MQFPTIQFKSTNIEMEPTWQTLVEQKFTQLEKFLGESGDVTCNVEFEKVTAQQSGNVHKVEANLYRAEIDMGLKGYSKNPMIEREIERNREAWDAVTEHMILPKSA
mgnify:CR=1 FL=1